MARRLFRDPGESSPTHFLLDFLSGQWHFGYMSLREELNQRFWDVALKADPYPNPGSLEWSEKVGDAIVEECLRQMAWTRQETANRAAGLYVSHGMEVPVPGITLAPPEWKP